MNDKKRVEMRELPHRPEELTPEQAERVHGGGSNYLDPIDRAADDTARGDDRPMPSLSLNYTKITYN